MYQSIGEVFLETISKARIDPSSQSVYEDSPLNLPYPNSTNMNMKLRKVLINGYLFKDTKKTKEEYVTDMNALMGRSVVYNRIKMNDLDGYIQIKNIEPRQFITGLDKYYIYGSFLSSKAYSEYYQFKQTRLNHSHAVNFPSYFILPYGVTSYDFTNRLNERIIVNKICIITTPEGSIPVFHTPDYLHGSNPVATDNVPFYETTILDGTDYNEWEFVPGFNSFSGETVIKLNCKITNSASELVTVLIKDENDTTILNQNITLTNTSFATITTNSVKLNKFVKYTTRINKVGQGEVVLDGIRMDQVDSYKHIRFNTPAPNMDKGECKVYDTVTVNEVDKTKWKRVYSSIDHTFTGQIVFENATMQWKINPSALWKNTGILTDRISNSVGTLYPEEFKEHEVVMGIIEILPDHIIVSFSMNDGTTKMNEVICTITPLQLIFKVKPKINYDTAYDWKLVITNPISVGNLNELIGSMVIFTTTSSITMVRSKLLNSEFTSTGFYSYDTTAMNGEYSFVISILPRVVYNTGKLYNSKNNSGADYYVDGEYIDINKTIYLSDFVNSIYESGLFINMNIAHKFYGDETW